MKTYDIVLSVRVKVEAETLENAETLVLGHTQDWNFPECEEWEVHLDREDERYGSYPKYVHVMDGKPSDSWYKQVGQVLPVLYNDRVVEDHYLVVCSEVREQCQLPLVVEKLIPMISCVPATEEESYA